MHQEPVLRVHMWHVVLTRVGYKEKVSWYALRTGDSLRRAENTKLQRA